MRDSGRDVGSSKRGGSGVVERARARKWTVVFVLIFGVFFPGAVSAKAPERDEMSRGWGFVVPLGNVLAVNGVVWATGRYILEADYSYIDHKTMAANLRGGFEWDGDNFPINHLGHAYQGAHYHMGARAAGFGFWGSLPFVFLGSLQWELFMENTRPAYNDMIVTVLAGAAVGEVFYRLSTSLLNPGAVGKERVLREGGATVLSPTLGLGRLISGASGGGSPGLAPPLELKFGAAVGVVQAVGEGARVPIGGAEGELRYGRFVSGYGGSSPFDWFWFGLGFDYHHKRYHGVHVETTGLLGSWPIRCGTGNECALGSTLRFDYHDSPAYKISATGVGLAALGELGLPLGALKLSGRLDAGIMPLGAFDSSYLQYRERDYNFSAGGYAELALELERPTYFRLQAKSAHYLGKTIHGVAGADISSRAKVVFEVPLYRRLALSVGAALFRRRERPDDFSSKRRRVIQAQANVQWRLR